MAESAEAEKSRNEGSPRQVAVAGAIAGIVSRFVIAPLDVVKIRLQLQSHHGGPDAVQGALRTFASIVRHEGIRALWKGNIPASALYPLYGTVQFTTYHALTSFLTHLPSPPSERGTAFLAGALAGAAATSTTYPLDLLRTRLAASYPSPTTTTTTTATSPTTLALFRAIATLRAERRSGALGSLRPFFRGLPAALLSIAPHMGLFFAGYETLRAVLHPLTLPFGTADAAAGTVASVAAKTAVFPLDTVRKRLQVQGQAGSGFAVHAGGVARTVREVVRAEGVRGLYRGLGVGLVKAAPAGAVTVWAFERVLAGLRRMEMLEGGGGTVAGVK